MLDIKELANELDDLRAQQEEAPLDTGDEIERLELLERLERDLGGDLHIFANNGEPLIEDGKEFEDYARDLADDLHGTEKCEWPSTCIDWKQAAEELQQDYTSIEFDGDTYWYRA